MGHRITSKLCRQTDLKMHRRGQWSCGAGEEVALQQLPRLQSQPALLSARAAFLSTHAIHSPSASISWRRPPADIVARALTALAVYTAPEAIGSHTAASLRRHQPPPLLRRRRSRHAPRHVLDRRTVSHRGRQRHRKWHLQAGRGWAAELQALMKAWADPGEQQHALMLCIRPGRAGSACSCMHG